MAAKRMYGATLFVTCATCRSKAEYSGADMAAAYKAAEKDGWRRLASLEWRCSEHWPKGIVR